MMALTSGIILIPGDNRKIVTPISDSRKKIWDLFNNGIKSQWAPDEIKYDQDYIDVQSLTPDQYHSIISPIAYFLKSDNYVIDDAIKQINYPIYEVNRFVAWKEFNESIHAITYDDMFKTIVQDPQQRAKYSQEIDEVPAIQNKYNWLNNCYKAISSVEEANIVNIATEGIHFASSFKFFEVLQSCPINNRYIMSGACRGNELIRRDEKLHVDAEIEIYKLSSTPVPNRFIYDIFDKAIEYEFDFIDYMLPKPFAIMNRDNMREYVKAHANSLLRQLGLREKYNVDITQLGLMHATSLTTRTNFLEMNSTEYINGVCPSDNAYSVKNDF